MVLGEEMLFNQTWLTETSCQRVCPLGPSTRAARCPGQLRALSVDTLHSDGHTTPRTAGVGAGFASASPQSFNPHASSRGLQTDQRFYAPRVPVRLRGLGVPPLKTSASGLFPYFFSCDFRGSSAVPRKAGSALVFLPASFSPEQEVYIHTAHGFHVNRGPAQPPQTEG